MTKNYFRFQLYKMPTSAATIFVYFQVFTFPYEWQCYTIRDMDTILLNWTGNGHRNIQYKCIHGTSLVAMPFMLQEMEILKHILKIMPLNTCNPHICTMVNRIHPNLQNTMKLPIANMQNVLA